MNNEPLEGQMALFETPAGPEKKKPAPKKAAREEALEAPVRKKAKNTAARQKTDSGKANRKTPGKNKGSAKARPTSGQVPEGDVRLTANIREDLHLKLKIAAAHKRTTIGELIEMLVAKHLK